MTQGSVIHSTPWRSRADLLEVRRWIYDEPSHNSVNAFGNDFAVQSSSMENTSWRRKACDKISAWKLRPPLPHAVESTWLIVEAMLADDYKQNRANIPAFSVQAGYLTALTRFVTALLDASQTSKYKVSMYTKAAELGLPAMFVDLRHEATHGEIPSLPVLRDAAQKALDWLWTDYWSKLDGREQSHGEGVAMGKGAPSAKTVEACAWETAVDWQTCPIGTIIRKHNIADA